MDSFNCIQASVVVPNRGAAGVRVMVRVLPLRSINIRPILIPRKATQYWNNPLRVPYVHYVKVEKHCLGIFRDLCLKISICRRDRRKKWGVGLGFRKKCKFANADTVNCSLKYFHKDCIFSDTFKNSFVHIKWKYDTKVELINSVSVFHSIWKLHNKNTL